MNSVVLVTLTFAVHSAVHLCARSGAGTEKREGDGWKQKYIDKERICVREIKRMD